MAQVPAETTSLHLPSEADGLPDASDRVVRELDVYLMNGELGSGTHTYLLQFPLRPPWRPYHTDTEDLQNVKLKPKVKKMQAEVPLDLDSRNYNHNAEDTRKIKTITLQSSRLDLRTSFAAGFVEEDSLLLLPVDEALQLRPSLAYLDKERESAAAAKRKGKEEEEEHKAPELLALTVQVKRRETEQQTEARLRSYAHLAAQEEADQWVPLAFHGDLSELAQNVLHKLSNVEQSEDVPHTLTRQQYLDAIVPGSSAQPNFETATWAAGAMAAQDMGRPAVAAAARSARSGSAPPPEVDIPTELQPAIVSSTLKLLRTVSVVNIDAIRKFLCKHQDAAVKSVAQGSSDAALHQAVTASGEVTHLRKSYFATKLGISTLDPLRDVVIELLREKDQLRRSEIVEAAKLKGINVSDSLYSKVVKELCTSRGAIWSLR